MSVSGQSSFTSRLNDLRESMLNALLSLPAVAGEDLRSLDATPFSPLDVTSPLNSLPLPDPTHAVWSALEIYVSAKTSRGTVLAGRASWTSRRTLSVVSREKVGSPQRSQIWAGICSTRTGRPSIVNTSLTNSFLAAVLPQTWQLNMTSSVSGNQPIHSGLAHKL